MSLDRHPSRRRHRNRSHRNLRLRHPGRRRRPNPRPRHLHRCLAYGGGGPHDDDGASWAHRPRRRHRRRAHRLRHRPSRHRLGRGLRNRCSANPNRPNRCSDVPSVVPEAQGHRVVAGRAVVAGRRLQQKTVPTLPEHSALLAVRQLQESALRTRLLMAGVTLPVARLPAADA